MYHGGLDDVRSGAGTPRLNYDLPRFNGGGASASRSGTPQSERRISYPTYDHSAPSIAGGGDLDYDYEERDLGRPQQQSRLASAQQVGPSYRNPIPARSSYSSPPPARSSYSLPPHAANGGNSWDVQSQYSFGHPPTPSSAPPEYPPYQQGNPFGHESFPGAYPDHRNEQVPVNDYYWYAGAPPSASSSHTYHSQTPMGGSSDRGFFGISAPHHHPGHHQSSRQGEVLPSFPQWSRTWYDGHMSANGHAYTNVPPPPGQSGWDADSLTRSGPSAYGHVYGQRGMTDFVKEERMRMLEKEFGKPKMSHNGGKGGEDDEDDEGDEDEIGDDEDLPLGSVTSTGKLITERPKWTLAIRILLGITTLAGCACGLGGALLIKTTSTNKPAPQGTIPAYLLYACSIITLLVMLYLYVFRACCCDPMRKEVKASGGPGNPLAGMVIPVLSGGQPGGKMKKGKFGKRGMQQQQAPTVNLIVDPALLGMGGGRKREDSEDDERLPGDARRSKKRKNGLGVMGNMQMQRRWQLARSKVKLLTTWDAILCVLWIACDIVSLGLGKKCATSGGWCEFYNAAIACGVILVVFLLGALYLDYRDLKVSQQAPKPPM